MSEQRRPIPSIQGYHCFACGTENPVGLHMSFHSLGDEVVSEVTLPAHLVGWENMAHGGVVSTLLDEIMAWTVLYFRRSFCVTREIRVRFLAPVRVGEPVIVSGRIVEGEQSRKYACKVAGKVIDAGSGKVLARAQADFAILRDEQLSLLPENVRKDMSGFLASVEQWDDLDD